MGSRGPGRRTAVAFAAAAFAAAILAGGCAAVPTNGPVQTGAGPNALGGEQVYSQPIPEGPGAHWGPTQIVSGFLSASASFVGNHAVAREYLDDTARKAWQPGWAVTVVSNWTTTLTAPPKPMAGQVEQIATVKATGLPVATLTGTGQYKPSTGAGKPYYYTLIKSGGQWRIDDLPTTQLLLTQTDFEHVYQSRDLYFLSESGRTLVPDPVFAPQQATNTELATGLVNALLQEPTGWLADAAQTGFPPGSSRVGEVRINGPNAIVDLGGKAVTARGARLSEMAAQLVWTLESGPATAIQSVQLELNGRPVAVSGNPYQLLSDYHGWVQSQPSGSSLYYIGSNGTVQALSGAGEQGAERISAIAGAAGTASAPALASIAVSPDRRSVAGIAQHGGAIYIGSMTRGAALREVQSPGGTVTSLSWDTQGDLWVSAGGDVWMYPPGGGGPFGVTPSIPPGASVTDFRVAPDGVRAAMIVKGTAGGRPYAFIEVAAITRGATTESFAEPVTIGSGIADPLQLSWYGADNLIALAAPGQLYEVPLNGGQPASITVTGGDPVSVSSTGPENSAPEIAVGLSDGTIMVSASPSGFEPTRAVGLAPVYPG
jgi:Lipoprotein LpqB beta-propeller domain/Sporulation and spore germination